MDRSGDMVVLGWWFGIGGRLRCYTIMLWCLYDIGGSLKWNTIVIRLCFGSLMCYTIVVRYGNKVVRNGESIVVLRLNVILLSWYAYVLYYFGSVWR